MRIAVSTSDGKTISGHLGRCRSFILYDAEGGRITGRSLVGVGGMCPGHKAEGDAAHDVSPLDGCDVVITQGMGQGLMNGLAQAGIQPVITQHDDPDTAVELFLRGELCASAVSNCSCGDH